MTHIVSEIDRLKSEVAEVVSELAAVLSRLDRLEAKAKSNKSVWHCQMVLDAVEVSINQLLARKQFDKGQPDYAEWKRLQKKRTETLREITE